MARLFFMAANTDKFKRLARKWVGSIGAGGVSDGTVTTIPLSSSSGLPTDTAVVATIDRVDANGVATPSLEESVVGVVSGDNLVTCTRGVEGTAQAHSAGAVVEILFTNKVWGDLIDGILAEHSQAGAHTTDTISEKTADAGVTVDGLKIKDGVAVYGDNAPNITPKAKAYPTNNQTIATGTWTKVVLNAEIYDVGNDFDSTTNYRFTAPVSGYYLVIGQLIWNSMGNNSFYLSIWRNGSSADRIVTDSIKPAVGVVHTQRIVDIVYLTANQYIELYCYQDSGSNVSTIS